MNLRVTSSFNTQQMQSSRQNPNFRMHTIEPSVVQHITSKLGASIEDALSFVHPGSKLTNELDNINWLAKLAIGKLMKKNPHIYYTHLDESAIKSASHPVEKARELVQQANPITKEAVDKALSQESIQAVEAGIQALYQGNPHIAQMDKIHRKNIGEDKYVKARQQEQKLLALWKLFGLNYVV